MWIGLYEAWIDIVVNDESSDNSPSQNPRIVYSVLKMSALNHFEPEFSIVIFIHYKPRIAVAILGF